MVKDGSRSTYPTPRTVWNQRGRPGLELAAQIADVDAEGSSTRAKSYPHTRSLMSDRVSTCVVAHEQLEQRELRASERYGLAVHARP